MKVALLGFDTEGRASYEFFKAQNAEITVCDQKTDIDVPDNVATQLGAGYLDNLDRFDMLVRTPGLHPAKILEKNPGVAGKITSQVNEFMRTCPTRHVIGVTGTKGKGTTSTLLAKMLEASGRQVFLGGNIGVPPLSFLDKLNEDSWVVLELSSFQLIDLQTSPHIGVCLMVVPEHLNWHADMPEYVEAKAQLFEHQSSNDVAIYYSKSDLSHEIATAGAGRKLPYYRSPGAFINGNMITIDGAEICTTDELKLLGAHNWQNVCAALTAYWQVDQNIDAARTVLTSFSGLEYHLELIREVDGVQYYNDSFGTTPETAIVALQAFEEPKILILGGGYKDVPFNKLATAIKRSNVRHVILIGNPEYGDDPRRQTAAPHLESALQAQAIEPITSLVRPGGPSMQEVVKEAQSAAQPGDVVLFSTACTSYDMFENYKERGAAFTAAVKALS
jgi:UDP-N-acetylmuramoylalanine--D-glutamate ligase